jgi:hypothetical protein
MLFFLLSISHQKIFYNLCRVYHELEFTTGLIHAFLAHWKKLRNYATDSTLCNFIHDTNSANETAFQGICIAYREIEGIPIP